MLHKKLVSIGIPCFNEERNIIPTYLAFKKVVDKIKKYNFEFIIVDNGSQDRTRNKIREIVKKDRRVRGVFLSRNFGSESSNAASIDYSTGDVFIGVPADLQDPPDLIQKLINKWELGYNVIIAIYKKNQDDFITSFLRKSFYKLIKKISDIDIPINAVGTGLLDKKALTALRSLPEKYRFFRGLRAWIGFKTAHIYYERNKRQKGVSSYKIFDYFKHAEKGLFGFSYLVLDLMVYTSFILVFLSFLFIVGYLTLFFLYGNPIKGAVTILVAIVFFGGIQLLAISIIGKYIQVIVEETKNRPVYIVDEVINSKNYSQNQRL